MQPVPQFKKPRAIDGFTRENLQIWRWPSVICFFTGERFLQEIGTTLQASSNQQLLDSDQEANQRPQKKQS